VRRALKTHRIDLAAIAILLVLAVLTVGYILLHQPAFTFGRSYYSVKAEFSTASAVTPGQGEAVTIAGVTVGTVGAIQVQGGRAVVTMDIDKRYAPIYQNATVLLQERTPLKDMYLSLDPGSRSAGAVPAGGTLGVGSTQPDIDVDQILGSLDADTRTYLLLLLAGGSQALSARNAPADLRAILKRFPPLASGTERFAKLLSQRSDNLRRAIHNLNLVSGALGGVDTELASLVRNSNTDFAAISSQDTALQRGLTLLPGALQQTTGTLQKVSRFAAATGPALSSLQPFTTELAGALKAVRPLARDTTPVIEHQLAPFTKAVEPLAKTLRPAATGLAAAAPTLASSFKVVNTLLNTLANSPPGKGQHSYLFWGAWLAHNLNSVTSGQDANGAVVRGLFMATCPALGLLENVLQPANPALGPLLDLLNAPTTTEVKSSFCPAAGL
jgi:phospholipid/cholesterol/gamma-HCH transport system substrate-binding protein